MKIVVALAAALLCSTACGIGPPPAPTGSNTPPPIASGAPNGDQLVTAQHTQCNVGPVVLRYLATGDNQGQTELDRLFADKVGVPAPQARAIADKYIEACDQKAFANDAAAASASAQVTKEAKAGEQQRDLMAQEAASCANIGGRYSSEPQRLCYSKNTGDRSCMLFGAPQYLTFRDGKIDPDAYRAAQEGLPGCWR